MAASALLSSLQSFLSVEESLRALGQVGENGTQLKWVFDIASSRVTDVEAKLKQAVAKGNSANINAEQRYHEVESKYVAARKDANDARHELEQLSKQHQSTKQREENANATITTLKEERSVLDRQLAETKKQARQEHEQRDTAENKCLQLVHELEQTKRQLKAKAKEVQSLTKSKNSLDEQFEKYRKQEGSSLVSGRKFEEKFRAEEKHAQFLEEELTKQREQQLEQRQRDGGKIIQLRQSLDEKKRETELLSSKCAQASKNLDSKQKKIESLRQELEETKQQAQEKESALHRQVELLNRMCRLHEDDSKDYKQKMDDTRGLARGLRQTIEKMARELQTERQASQKSASHFEKDEARLKEQIEKLEQQLAKAQDEGARRGRKQALLDSKSTSDVLVLMTQHTGKEIVMDWYERLIEAETKLKQVQDEKQKLETHMTAMLKAWEEKAPVFKNLRRDYHKAVKSRAALSDRLSQAVRENEQLTERLRRVKENQDKLQTENSALNQSLEDVTQQVRKLLAEQGGTNATESYMRDDDDDVISQRLKVFSNIKELHDKNLQLLTIVRKLAAGKNEEAAAAQARRDKKAGEERNAFKRQVEEMVAARKKLMLHHQGVVQQRDMYKKMFLAQKDPNQAPPNADLAIVVASGRQSGLANHTEVEKFKEEASRYKVETNRTISDQDNRIDALIKEKSSLQEKLMHRTVENNRLSAENSRLLHQERSHCEDLTKERSYNKDLQQEIVHFRQDVKDKEIKLDTLSSTLNQTLEEKIHTETKLNIAEREKTDMAQEKEKLVQEQAQYENLLKKMQQIEEGLITQKNEELTELRKQRDMLNADIERQTKIADETRVEMLDMRTRHHSALAQQEELVATKQKELTAATSALLKCQEDLRTTAPKLQETTKALEVLKAKHSQDLELTQRQLVVSDGKLENALEEQKKLVAREKKDNKALSTLIGALQENSKGYTKLNDKLRADLAAAQLATKEQAIKLIKQVDKTKNALQAQTKIAEATTQKLRDAQKSSNDTVTTLQAQISKLDAQVHRVSTELSQTKEQLNEKQHAISAAEARYRQEHAEHAKDLDEIERLRKTLEESKQVLAVVQQKCAEVQLEKDKLEILSTADQNHLRLLEKQLREIKERHEQQIKHWMHLVEKLQRQQGGSNKGVDNARDSAIQLQRDEHRRNELLSMQMQNLKSELEKQKLETTSQSKKVVQLTADLEVAHQAAKNGNDISLEKQLDEARDQKIKADMAWHNLKGRNDQLEKREKKLQKEKQQLELKLAPLKDQIAKMEIKINKLQALRKAEVEERTNLRKRLQEMTNANSQWEGKKKLDEEIKQLKAKVKVLEAQGKKLVQERTKLTQDVAEASKHADATKAQLARIIPKMNAARAEDQKRHQAVAEALQKKHQALQKNVEQLNQQDETAKQNKLLGEKLVKKLSSRLKDLQQKNAHLQKKNAQYKKFVDGHIKRKAQAKAAGTASKAPPKVVSSAKQNQNSKQPFAPTAKKTATPNATKVIAAQKEQALRAKLVKVAAPAAVGTTPGNKVNKPSVVAPKRKLAAASAKPVPKKIKTQAVTKKPATKAPAPTTSTAAKTDAAKDPSMSTDMQ